MDKSKFTSTATGRLVEIERADHPQKKDWAFIPNPLPATWEFDHTLWPQIAEARDKLGNLNGIGTTLEDAELLLRPLRNSEAMASSKIEGTFVTPEQLLLYEMNPREPRSADDRVADWMEVHNYNEALKVGVEMMKTHCLGVHVIRSLHSVLMRGVRGRDKSPGRFRQRQVQIGSTARYIPPPCSDVEPLMQNLESYIADDSGDIDPLAKCFIVHYQFEAIHPFEDGNGRVGRVLLALMIHKLLGHVHPWLYLSAYLFRYQDEYFANMFRVSTHGDWAKWIAFCLNGTILQAADSISRCHRFAALKEEYHERIKSHSPSPRSHPIIDGLFREPMLTIASLRKQMGVHYTTAKNDVGKLVDADILRPLINRTFYAHEIMSIAYASGESF